MKHIFLTVDGRSKRRKLLAVTTQLKQLQQESMKKIQAEFFSGFLSQLLKLHTNCEDLSSI